jgi:hypothetical protein
MPHTKLLSALTWSVLQVVVDVLACTEGAGSRGPKPTDGEETDMTTGSDRFFSGDLVY